MTLCYTSYQCESCLLVWGGICDIPLKNLMVSSFRFLKWLQLEPMLTTHGGGQSKLYIGIIYHIFHICSPPTPQGFPKHLHNFLDFYKFSVHSVHTSTDDYCPHFTVYILER